MSSIRRTLLIFLVLFSVSSAAFGAAGSTYPEHRRIGVDPAPAPVPEAPGWPDNGEPDGGGQSLTQGGSSAEPSLEPRVKLASLIRWLGKVMLARNLGIGL